jgi:hypothetical protein
VPTMPQPRCTAGALSWESGTSLPLHNLILSMQTLRRLHCLPNSLCVQHPLVANLQIISEWRTDKLQTTSRTPRK